MKKIKTSGALVNRFEEILENKLTQDPHLRKELKFDSHIKQIQDKLSEENQFKHRYSNQLNYLGLENLLKHNKHGKEIASSKPWDGTESNRDANLRMIIDLKPKLNVKRNVGTRLTVAKEITDEYKQLKDLGINKADHEDEREKFRQMYKEKLLGPGMLLNNSNVTVNLINTIATSKINSHINQSTGNFEDEKMSEVRGKPLNKDHLVNCTNTTYFVNQILNKQNALPPWIENQQELNLEIKMFRQNLQRSLVQYLKKNGVGSRHQLFESFKSLNNPYLLEKIKSINDKIRDYNLQSPSHNFHKFKLVLSDEITTTFNDTYDKLPELMKNNEYISVPNNDGFSSLFNLEQKAVPQRPVQKLNFWESFKEMFIEVKKVSN